MNEQKKSFPDGKKETKEGLGPIFLETKEKMEFQQESLKNNLNVKLIGKENLGVSIKVEPISESNILDNVEKIVRVLDERDGRRKKLEKLNEEFKTLNATPRFGKMLFHERFTKDTTIHYNTDSRDDKTDKKIGDKLEEKKKFLLSI